MTDLDIDPNSPLTHLLAAGAVATEKQHQKSALTLHLLHIPKHTKDAYPQEKGLVHARCIMLRSAKKCQGQGPLDMHTCLLMHQALQKAWPRVMLPAHWLVHWCLTHVNVPGILS